MPHSESTTVWEIIFTPKSVKCKPFLAIPSSLHNIKTLICKNHNKEKHLNNIHHVCYLIKDSLQQMFNKEFIVMKIWLLTRENQCLKWTHFFKSSNGSHLSQWLYLPFLGLESYFKNSPFLCNFFSFTFTSQHNYFLQLSNSLFPKWRKCKISIFLLTHIQKALKNLCSQI